jgi:hypothetical protein
MLRYGCALEFIDYFYCNCNFEFFYFKGAKKASDGSSKKGSTNSSQDDDSNLKETKEDKAQRQKL